MDEWQKKLTNTTIVVTSDEPWSDVWHTQLHYAYELSKFCEVIFINPPPKGVKYKKQSAYRITNDLLIAPYIKILPVKLGKISTIVNDYFTSLNIKNKINPINKIILWRIDHFRMHKLYLKNVRHSIYHVIDHWVKFPEDFKLARESNLVVYTSPRFKIHYDSIAKKAINIPQGVSDDESQIDDVKVKEIKERYGPYLFSCGTFSDSVDLNILIKVANEFSSVALLLAGPVTFHETSNLNLFKSLLNKSNVKYIGIIPGKELKNYIAASSICLIHYPFELQSVFSVRSPLKVINYIAQNKPVVTSYQCEIESLEDKAIYFASNPEEYIQKIRLIMDGTLSVDVIAIQSYLKSVRYSELIKIILKKLFEV